MFPKELNKFTCSIILVSITNLVITGSCPLSASDCVFYADIVKPYSVIILFNLCAAFCRVFTQYVPLATESGISLIILLLMRILQRNLKRTTDTFLFISHTTNVRLFKFLCNIFIGVTIIKEMSGLLTSGTLCIFIYYKYIKVNLRVNL
jgi:hypothetical protein